MTMPGLLEVAAHGITALLATWLGLTVLVRSPRRLSSRVFAFITLLLVVWSVRDHHPATAARRGGEPSAARH